MQNDSIESSFGVTIIKNFLDSYDNEYVVDNTVSVVIAKLISDIYDAVEKKLDGNQGVSKSNFLGNDLLVMLSSCLTKQVEAMDVMIKEFDEQKVK